MLRVVAFLLFACLMPSLARADPPSFLRRDVVARATHLAVAHAGADPQAHHDLAARARASGWLPQVSVRVVHGMGAIAAIDTNSLLHTTNDDTLALDFGATFHLDHLVFHPSEVMLERAESRRADRRDAVEREVIELLVTLERARLDGSPGSDDALRARARLELMVGTDLESLLAGH